MQLIPVFHVTSFLFIPFSFRINRYLQKNNLDLENKKNLQSDEWRYHQLEKSLSNPKHPFSRFGTGNLETLKKNPINLGVDIRDELLKFHDKYYSANIMKLVLLGKESLDQLTQWVVEKFSAVKNKGIPVPTFEGHPLTENEMLVS
jgi:insulysin